MPRVWAFAAIFGLVLVLAACEGGDEEDMGPATAASPTVGANETMATGEPSVTVIPRTVSPGDPFTIELRDLPDDVASGARQVCVGVVALAGNEDVIKLGQVASGRANRDIEAVLPPDMKSGTYEVVLAPCDFAPNSTIVSRPFVVE